MSSDAELIISANSDGVAAGMRKAGAAVQEGMEKIKMQFEGLDASIKKIGSAFSLFGEILMAGAVGEGIKELVLHTAELGDEMGKAAQKVGVPVEQLSALKYSADLADVSFEALQKGLKKLAMSMNLAGQGSKQQKDAFAAIGVSVADAQGHLRPMGDVLGDVADKFSTMKDSTGKTALAMTLFGKSGADMIPFLNQGKEGIAATSDEAKKLGLVFSDQTAKASEEMNDNLKRLHASFTGLTQQLVSGFIPGISDIVQGMTDSLGPGGLMHGMLAAISEVVKSAIDVFRNLWSVVTQIASVFGDAFTVIGQAIMSVFGASGSGITAMEFFKNVLALIEVAVIGFRVGIEIAIEAIKAVLAALVAHMMRMAAVAERALHGDFSGAVAAWKTGTKEIEDIVSQSTDNIVAIATKGAADMQDAIMGGKPAAPGAPEEKSKQTEAAPDLGGTKKAKGSADMVGQWRSELEQQKEATGNFFKDTLSMEDEFWQSKLAKVKAGTKEYRAVEHELYQVHKQQATQGLANDLQDIRAQLADAKAGSEQRIQLANDVANRIGQSYGIESRQYKQALEDSRKEARAWEAEQIKSMQAVRDANEKHSLEMLKIEEDELAQKLKMEQVSDQQAAQQLIALKDQEYKIEVDALNAKLQLGDLEVGARQKMLDQLLELERKHALDVKKITDQASTQENATWKAMLDSISGGFATSMNGMIMGTTTFQKAMANMGQSILSTFISIEVKKVTTWLATELAKTQATAIGESTRLAITKTAAAEGSAASATAGLADVMKNAYKAASGAYAAIVGIPYVGPFLAPAAAAVAFAATAAFGSGISAEGGYDIPAGVNPLVQTHQREMILPAEHADTIRGLAGGGGAGGATHVHFHSMMTDRRSVEQFFKQNSSGMAAGIRSVARNFVPANAKVQP